MENGGPSVAALASGAPSEARRPRRASPKPQGLRFPSIPSPGQGCFALWGLQGPQPHPYRM
eukprot:2781503-Alexandrium_andersonii.AAC.1